MAARIGAERLPLDTIVEVDLYSGSLKGKVLFVIPVLFGSFNFVSGYKGFKEGIPEIIADGKYVAGKINDLVLGQPEVRGATVFRTERRSRTPGKIARYIKKREWVSTHRTELSAIDLQQESAKLGRLESEILSDIAASERSKISAMLNDPELPITTTEPERMAVTRSLPEQSVLFDATEITLPKPSDFHSRFRIREQLQNSPFSTASK